jgi:hypothetical protein
MNATASQTFVLKNTGGSATGALAVGFGAGSSSAFSKTADTCTAMSLGPKKQCSVTVQYAPTTAGSTDNGTLTVSSRKPVAVATATLTGKSTAAPTCTSGSENFNADVLYSEPTTFSGGTIDTAYGDSGGVLDPVAGFSNNFLYTGFGVNSFKLTFTNAVNSVQLNAEAATFADTNLTLTGFNASNSVVDTQTAVGHAATMTALSISDSTNGDRIKYFTIATDDPNIYGVGFTDIVWGCAA